MSMDDNKKIARRWMEDGYGGGDTSVLYALADATWLEEASIPAQIGAFHEAFPDLAMTVDEQIAEGDRVMTRVTYTGTHTGALLGIPPTGKPIHGVMVQIHTIHDGKVTDTWSDFDPAKVLLQIGVLKSDID